MTCTLRAERGALLLTSYASAATDKSTIIDVCKHLRVMLVVDESHRVKRFRGGVWAPALVEMARYARIRTILSGTPMPQSGKDLYSQLNILWPGGDLTGPPETFATRVQQDFAGVLNDVLPFVSRTPKKALGLPPYTVTVHDVRDERNTGRGLRACGEPFSEARRRTPVHGETRSSAFAGAGRSGCSRQHRTRTC